jgi:hypothetical protein
LQHTEVLTQKRFYDTILTCIAQKTSIYFSLFVPFSGYITDLDPNTQHCPSAKNAVTRKEINMKIKIMSDSTCDLSPELVKKYDIGIVPLIVVKDGTQYADGVNITPTDIFAHVASGGDLCSTAALSVGEYQDHFSKYAAEYDGILHINISSGFSSSYQNACLAADEFENVAAVVRPSLLDDV